MKRKYFQEAFLGNIAWLIHHVEMQAFHSVNLDMTTAIMFIQLVKGMASQWIVMTTFFVLLAKQVFTALSGCLVITVALCTLLFLSLSGQRRKFWVRLATYNIESSQWSPAWRIPFTLDILRFHQHKRVVHLASVDWEKFNGGRKKIQ